MPEDYSWPTTEAFGRALARLRPLELEIVILTGRDGLSNAEAGRRLGLRERKVERILARALARIDRILAG